MDLSETINRKEPFTKSEIYKLVWNLSTPSILAQLTYIIMEYIDAIMVGSLGVKSAGAIGLVATSTWFLYGLCRACSSGFSVQVAQAVGANDSIKFILPKGKIFTIPDDPGYACQVFRFCNLDHTRCQIDPGIMSGRIFLVEE